MTKHATTLNISNVGAEQALGFNNSEITRLILLTFVFMEEGNQNVPGRVTGAIEQAESPKYACSEVGKEDLTLAKRARIRANVLAVLEMRRQEKAAQLREVIPHEEQVIHDVWLENGLILPKEVQEFGSLSDKYKGALDTLKFYSQKNPKSPNEQPLISEDPEKPGNYFYRADYDGSKEKDGKGENLTGRRFDMPGYLEVLSALTPENIKLYCEMKQEGLEPRLQFTPIGYTIATLIQMINAKRLALKRRRYPAARLRSDLREDRLIYEADSLTVSSLGFLHITGGKSKSAWIKENQGWKIDIVSMTQHIRPDHDKSKNTNGQRYTNAQKVEKYYSECHEKGYHGLSYETYAIAQMEAIRCKKYLDRRGFTILPESSITNWGHTVGLWMQGELRLGLSENFEETDRLHFRRSVRVKLQAPNRQ